MGIRPGKGSPKSKRILIVLGIIFIAVPAAVCVHAGFRSGKNFLDDSAKPAGYTIVLSGEPIDEINLSDASCEAEYHFSISNYDEYIISEVYQTYEINIKLAESLPEGITLQIDNISGTTQDGLNYAFRSQDFLLESGKNRNEHILKVFSCNAVPGKYSNMIEIFAVGTQTHL